jgi:MFS family permease
MKNHEALSAAQQPAIKVSSARAWFSIVIIVLLVIFAMIDRNAINLMVDPVRKSLGINDFEISLLQGSAFAVFFLLGSLLMGWLMDRYSNRWLIYIGVTIWSIATIASGFSASFTALLIARCFVGLGESVLQPAGWNIVSKLFPPHRMATAMGILTAGSAIGVAASFLLTGFLIAKTNEVSFAAIPFIGGLEPWQLVFVSAGVPGILLGAMIYILPNDKPTSTAAEKLAAGGVLQYMKKNKSYLTNHFLGFGFLSIMVNGTAAWGATYMIRTHAMDIKNIGLLLGLVGVPLSVGGVVFAGFLVDRAFKNGKQDAHLKQFAIRGLLAAILGSICFMFDSNLIFQLVCFGLVQFIQPFSGVAGAALQVSIPEVFRAKISAIFIMFYNAVGMMLGPTFVALISNSLGEGQLGTAITLNYALFGTAAAFMLWRGRKGFAQAVNQQSLTVKTSL